MKSSAQIAYENLEQEYEVIRLAVEAGEIPQAKLEKVASKTLAAANTWATQKGWVLPEVK
jgi:hypothetical protein